MISLRLYFGYGVFIACLATATVYEKTFLVINIKNFPAHGRGQLELLKTVTALGFDINTDYRILGINLLDNSTQIQLVNCISGKGRRAKNNARIDKGTAYRHPS
ncbi:MAG: hypothetical protein NTY00_11615 [Deltaproteobacteria bacterium]|nr:hypothetical protein [Deltaproteobacteria bacterium]